MAGHVTSCASHAASGNDYQKERQFKKINSQKDSIEVAMVRGGKQTVVKNTDVVVGDVLLLNTGDKAGSGFSILPVYRVLAGLSCKVFSAAPHSEAASSMGLSFELHVLGSMTLSSL